MIRHMLHRSLEVRALERSRIADASGLNRRRRGHLRRDTVVRPTRQRARCLRPTGAMSDAYDNVAVLRPHPSAETAQPIDVRPVEKVPLFTRHTLAAYLDLHVNTIDRLVKRGELAAYRVAGKLRFYPEDVERYIRERPEER
jgi:excisionase family DNA binding protein